mmetsp:Transcript_41424/g.81893  ORF Transcript_41424/g.81893 Transcript_41424/m.81893 type:complete len:221 (-) Transcript_41424:210-872(-)
MWMFGKDLCRLRTCAHHQVEDPAWQACSVDGLSNEDGVDGSHFTWLEHDRATSEQCGCNFGGNLIYRPVPWSNATHHTNGFLDNCNVSSLLSPLKSVWLCKSQCSSPMICKHACLNLLCKTLGSTQLLFQCSTNGTLAFVVLFQDALKVGLPLGNGRAAPRAECPPCSFNCMFCIRFGTARSTGKRFACVAVNHIDECFRAVCGCQPLTVNVLFAVGRHC